jgi:hypothetical protein
LGNVEMHCLDYSCLHDYFRSEVYYNCYSVDPHQLFGGMLKSSSCLIIDLHLELLMEHLVGLDVAVKN